MADGTPTVGKTGKTAGVGDKLERVKSGGKSGSVMVQGGMSPPRNVGETGVVVPAPSVSKEDIKKLRSEFRAYIHATESTDQSRMSSDNRMKISESLAGIRNTLDRMAEKCLQLYSEREIVSAMCNSTIDTVKTMLKDAKRRARKARRNCEDMAKLIDQQMGDHWRQHLGKDLAEGVSGATAGAVSVLELYSEKMKSTLDVVTTRMAETAEVAETRFPERTDALSKEVSQLREVVSSTPAAPSGAKGGGPDKWTLVGSRKVRIGSGKEIELSEPLDEVLMVSASGGEAGSDSAPRIRETLRRMVNPWELGVRVERLVLRNGGALVGARRGMAPS